MKSVDDNVLEKIVQNDSREFPRSSEKLLLTEYIIILVLDERSAPKSKSSSDVFLIRLKLFRSYFVRRGIFFHTVM